LVQDYALVPSPFLDISETDWLASNAHAFAIRDGHPVSIGHTLVVTRRGDVESWVDATREERQALLDLVDVVWGQLDAEYHPDGYNIGINIGPAAGQTIPHLHVHVIPRYLGDVDDPRGGVRHVIPGRGNYLRDEIRPLATGGPDDPFLEHVRPLLARATEIAVIAAFVQDSGLGLLRGAIMSAVDRGARVRVITGDYLHVTQAAALSRLLDWTSASAAHERENDDRSGSFEARVVQMQKLRPDVPSFHPKSWRFEGDGFGAAFVGSSNISHAALQRGIEWNLRVERNRDPQAYAEVVDAFERWWAAASPLTADWVASYAERVRLHETALPVGEEEAEPLPRPPEPHPLQRDALTALDETRASGRRRALVVMATGLGKTWLAAFDVEAVRRARGRLPRVLFLAHRSELLEQAAETFRRMFPDARFAWFAGERSEIDGDVLLASVQKLSRAEHLARLAAEGRASFDYTVVDEVHHATAASYRRILERIEPGFLLGLTATPDRADEADVAGLFDDNVPYRADLGVGIAERRLCPFRYYGLKDVVDYANIPWRNRRFDPTVLAAAVQTQARMERMWAACTEHEGKRSLVFCASIPHATFVRDWLAARGVRAAAVHSGPGSEDRDASLAALERGDLDAVCSVDLFNEGVDVPRVDRVVMLRPTESPVVFLQQLGRGLRVAAGKEFLTVIDFVGNHRVFLDRVRLLVSLGPRPVTLREFLVEGKEPELPEGCSVDVEIAAIDMLRRFLPVGATEVERVYRELEAARGFRPTAGELCRMGYRPGTLRSVHGSWFEFVASEGHLDEAEVRVLAAARPWLRELETTPMTKSFKMVVLEALLEREALGAGMSLDEIAERSHAYLLRFPELMRDLDGVRELPDPRAPEPDRWLSYWRKNPIQAWAGRDVGEKPWFRIDEEQRLVPRLPECPGDEAVLAAMTRELVDWRLAAYVQTKRSTEHGDAFECVVLSNRRDPILKLPPRTRRPDVPLGEADVRLSDGTPWRFRFMKEFCNVARPAGEVRNRLPDLLRGWFGPAAGRSGTGFRVRFAPSPDGWWVEPAGEGVIEKPAGGLLMAFPSLRAAAGAARMDAVRDAPATSETVRLPVSGDHDSARFAVRAVGDSMDGGEQPIRDGDWLVMRYARAARLDALDGRVALIAQRDVGGASVYQVKRIVRDGGGWMLRSDNPSAASFEASERTVPVALLEQVISPEDLAPRVGERMSDRELSAAFGLVGDVTGGRQDGHLFLLVTEPGALVAPDRLRCDVHDRRPGETAFVLTRPQGSEAWRYAGVGRWLEDEKLWSVPELDFSTWRALGSGRETSRRLPPGRLDEAAAVVRALLDRVREDGWIGEGGHRARIVGESARGGLRIDGGPEGFQERTVSLVDIAWVLVARDDVALHGGVLDEARVNRVRYLAGTSKGSTRWIDTGWAIAAVRTAGGTA